MVGVVGGLVGLVLAAAAMRPLGRLFDDEFQFALDVNMIVDQRNKIIRPTGMDVENILVVESQPFAPEFEDEDYVRAGFEEDLRKLRALPGVRAASAMQQIPLSGGGSATGRRPVGSDEETATAPYFVVSADILETLGVELVEGRDFVDKDFPADADNEEESDKDEESDEPTQRNIIVTQAMADRLFPDGGALGKSIEGKSRASVETIVGIVKHMHGSWPLSSVADRVVFYAGMPASSRRARYVVRTEPRMVDDLYTTVETELLQLNEGRILEVKTLAEIKASLYSDFEALNKMLAGLSVLLVVVTSLGVIGLTSFSVTQRMRQIGTRRALGATRFAILRYFLVENWVITGIGLLLGIVLTYGLNYLLAHLAELPMIDWPLVGTGMLFLWLVGLLAALTPALRGATVPPVIATRTV
jgi:putative ABC transport system permease protein